MACCVSVCLVGEGVSEGLKVEVDSGVSDGSAEGETLVPVRRGVDVGSIGVTDGVMDGGIVGTGSMG